MTDSRFTQDDVDRIVKTFRETLLDIPEERFDDWLAHWTEDARLMPPGMADVVGHVALTQWMSAWPAVKRFDVLDTDVEGEGDLAVLVCHFTRVLAAADGGEVEQYGRQVLKLHRQPDGRWLIAAAIFNADHRSGAT